MKNALYIGTPILLIIAITMISRWAYVDSQYATRQKRMADSLNIKVITLTFEEAHKRETIRHLDSDIHQRTLNLNLVKELDSFYGNARN